MNRIKQKTIRSALIAGLMALPFAGQAFAQQQQQQRPPEGWFKLCQKQNETDLCNVQNFKTSNESGQLLVAVSLIELKGKVNRRIMQVTVPAMRMLQAGVGMQIDGGKVQKLNYVICPLQPSPTCIAEAPLNDELVNSMKRGGELTVTAINFQNQPTPVKVSLTGFTQAFDGEPMQQSDLQERQKELQAEIEKRKEEFEKKLKAEQDKAKSN